MKFSDLVYESPETLDFPSALHQVRDAIRRRLQKDLVHESPETLDFPLALHQVRDPIQRYFAKARSKTFRACFKCSSVTVSGGSKRTFSPAGPAVMHRTPFFGIH